jgi:hypothetical protein
MMIGKQRLLAVRVSTATEEPDESAALIAAALFGNNQSGSGSGGSESPLAPTTAAASSLAGSTSVTWHYQAVSHGRLQFVPAVVTNVTHTENGVVLDVSLNGIAFQGSYMHDLMDAIWNATEVALTQPVRQVADAVVFCLPTGSWLDDASASDNESSWTAFSYLWEPVRGCGVMCVFVELEYAETMPSLGSESVVPSLTLVVSPHWLLISSSIVIIKSRGALDCPLSCTRYARACPRFVRQSCGVQRFIFHGIDLAHQRSRGCPVCAHVCPRVAFLEL